MNGKFTVLALMVLGNIVVSSANPGLSIGVVVSECKETNDTDYFTTTGSSTKLKKHGFWMKVGVRAILSGSYNSGDATQIEVPPPVSGGWPSSYSYDIVKVLQFQKTSGDTNRGTVNALFAASAESGWYDFTPENVGDTSYGYPAYFTSADQPLTISGNFELRVVTTMTVTWVDSSSVSHTKILKTFVPITYTITKGQPQIQSVDTRKGYGKANLEGEYPGDPNAPYAGNVFSPYKFKGGLFIGNAPDSYDADGKTVKDHSGKARIVMDTGYTSTATSTAYTDLVALTLFDQGGHANMTDGMRLMMYFPDSTDVNLSQSMSEMNWEKSWGVKATGGNSNTALHADLTSTVAGGSPNNWLGNPMTFESMTATPYRTCSFQPVIPSYTGTTIAPTSKLVLVPEYGAEGEFDPDTTFGDGYSIAAWRYFANSQYQTDHSSQGFPFTDCAPRFWTVSHTRSVTQYWN